MYVKIFWLYLLFSVIYKMYPLFFHHHARFVVKVNKVVSAFLCRDYLKCAVSQFHNF